MLCTLQDVLGEKISTVKLVAVLSFMSFLLLGLDINHPVTALALHCDVVYAKGVPKVSCRAKWIPCYLLLKSPLTFGVHSYFGELVNIWLSPVKCRKGLTQTK